MILRILILLLALLILPAYFIDHKFFKNKKKTFRILFWSPNILLSILTFYFAFFESYSPNNSYWTGIYLVVTFFITIPEAFFTIVTSIGLIYKSQKTRRIFYRLACLIGFTSGFAVLYGYFYGYTNLQVKTIHFSHHQIPKAFNNFKITQLTDFHIGTFAGKPTIVQEIVDSINAQNPDLVVFTGDLVNYHAEEMIEFLPILKQIKAKNGVLSIMGNHDYMLYAPFENEKERWKNIYKLQHLEREIGWNLLLNENITITSDSSKIAIIGVENDGKPPFPERGDLKKAQRGLEENCFKILLSHDPSHWRRKVIPQTDIPLMLAGHTHGFQFQIFGFSPAQWFYPEWDGLYKKGNQSLYVSIGVGEVLLPIRLGSWPEINNIILKSTSK